MGGKDGLTELTGSGKQEGQVWVASKMLQRLGSRIITTVREHRSQP